MSSVDNLTITRLLTTAAERQSSDLHLSVGSQPVVRRDGKLEVMAEEAVLTPELVSQMVEFFLPVDKRSLLVQQKVASVAFSLGTRARFRVHVSYQKGYPALDLRYIPWQVPTAANLGLPKRLLELVSEREGLLVISGPRGSGRTTTLAALVDLINHVSARHIVTLEDPVEYLLVNDRSFIKQRDLGDDVPNLEVVLASLRAEDVDVVAVDVPVPLSSWPSLVGLATSGALVLAVVESDSSVGALSALTSSWPGVDADSLRQLLARGLLGVTSQRLLPRLGGGRILVAELLLGTPSVKALIRDGKILQLESVLETSRQEGMLSLDRGLANLVRTGEVMTEEALAQAVNRESLQSMLRVK